MPGKRESRAAEEADPTRDAKTGTRTPRQRRLRIMVVDDHPVWRDAVREILEGKGVGTIVAQATDGYEVTSVARASKPDVVVMDMGLPALDGAQATRALVGLIPELKVLVLSASNREQDVLAALRAGATGYLLKTAGSAEIVAAVGRVHRGEVVLPSSLAEVVLRQLREGKGESERCRVVVADPSGVSGEGLARVLEQGGFDVVAGARNGGELLAALDEVTADVVVLDVRLPAKSPEDVHPAVAVRQRHPSAGILVLTDQRDVSSAVGLGSAGSRAFGYVLKDRVHDAEHLARMVRRVAAGEWVVDPDLAHALVAPRGERSLLDELSRREREVLALMAEGRSNQAIADTLSLTPKTVEAHVRHIFTKLELAPAPDDHRRVLAVLAYLRSV